MSKTVRHALNTRTQMGPVAPFDASAAALLVGGVGISLLWTENYGESRHQVSISNQFKMAFAAILSGVCF